MVRTSTVHTTVLAENFGLKKLLFSISPRLTGERVYGKAWQSDGNQIAASPEL